jgi:hypothetical protein
VKIRNKVIAYIISDISNEQQYSLGNKFGYKEKNVMNNICVHRAAPSCHDAIVAVSNGTMTDEW